MFLIDKLSHFLSCILLNLNFFSIKMDVLSKEDLIEIRVLIGLGYTPQQIYEYRIANTVRGARDWKRTTIQDACKKIQAQRGSVEWRHESDSSNRG